MKKWYERIGNTIEMNIDNQWVKGIIVEGYRTHDGMINMKTLTGKMHGCGVGMENVAFRKCEDSLGDLITYADHIRSMNDEELTLVVMCPNETGLANIICDHSDSCDCDKCTLDWLQSEVEE